MADHKAPTSVTIASTEEETAFSAFIHKHWKTGLTVILAIGAGVMIRQYMQSKTVEKVDASWNRLAEAVSFEGMIQPQSADLLADMAVELQGQDAAPWAKAIEIGARMGEGDLEGAQNALSELEAGWPDHDVVTRPWPDGEGGTAPLPQQVRSRIQALADFEAGLTSLKENAPLPEGSPQVRLETSAGPIVVGLYQDRAPLHVENFLKHCRSNFYDGTRFHRVMADFMIQGGDPNSKDADKPETWGQGGPDPDYTVPAEITDLKHFKYVFAAAKNPTEVDSSGSQFYITVGDPHHLDGQHTVYGVVVSGQEVVDQIAAGEPSEENAERPKDPVILESTVVL